MNILNLLILAFVLGMAYWWSGQGLFSSLLHLVAVIVAGALALALWEVFALDLIMGLSPRYAWPVGLLAPFMLFLLIIRLLFDRLIRGNMHFAHLINMLAGGLVGVLSGILTAGIVVLGLSFLPVGPSLAGYQPLQVGDQGQIVGNVGDSLWLPVDRYTAGFYNTLSAGALSSRTPLRTHQPNLATQAVLYRMSYDINASPAASPEKLAIGGYFTALTPRPPVDDSVLSHLGDDARRAGHQFVLIETIWHQLPGMFDGDSTLRVSPTQIRLVATDRDGNVRLVAPLGASQAGGQFRSFIPFNDNRSFVWGNGQEISLAWVFLIQSEERPRSLLVRHVRLDLPDEDTGEPADAIALAGVVQSQADLAILPGEEGDGTSPAIGDTSGPASGQSALNIVVDNKLPERISKNMVQGFQFDGNGIIRGEGTARKLTNQVTQEVILDHIHTPSHLKIVRMQISREQAGSLFGAARVAAAQTGGVWLEDTTGEKWLPIGYVLHRASGEQVIKIDMGTPIQSARQLPLSEIQPGDTFHLYFSVKPGVHLASYTAGSQTTEINLRVPR